MKNLPYKDRLRITMYKVNLNCERDKIKCIDKLSFSYQWHFNGHLKFPFLAISD